MSQPGTRCHVDKRRLGRLIRRRRQLEARCAMLQLELTRVGNEIALLEQSVRATILPAPE